MRKRPSKAMKAYAKKGERSKRLPQDITPESDNKPRFEQLLDDAIFGVKKKTPRG